MGRIWQTNENPKSWVIETDSGRTFVGIIPPKDAEALAAYTAMKAAGVVPEPFLGPPPVVVIAKVDLFRKMSEVEFSAMLAGVATQSPRTQGIFNAAVNFRSDAEEWGLLKNMAVKLFGPQRAAELLTP